MFYESSFHVLEQRKCPYTCSNILITNLISLTYQIILFGNKTYNLNKSLKRIFNEMKDLFISDFRFGFYFKVPAGSYPSPIFLCFSNIRYLRNVITLATLLASFTRPVGNEYRISCVLYFTYFEICSSSIF